MANIYHYLTDSANISDIPIEVGNLIFCEDRKKIYFDSTNGRVCYDSIIIFETEDDRLDFVNPFESFYYVKDSKMLWRYDEFGWQSLIEPLSRNVYFIEKEFLPDEGEYDVLYVCGDEQYIWKDDTYVQITAESKWHEI